MKVVRQFKEFRVKKKKKKIVENKKIEKKRRTSNYDRLIFLHAKFFKR